MTWDPIIRIGLAVAFTLPIGVNRELEGKPAGIRTHLLIATAAAALGWVSVQAAANDPSADPTRIAADVVSGVGFLGAGVILSMRGRVHGLTTATAVFAAMAIGLVTGMGHVVTGGALAVVAFLALLPLDKAKAAFLGSYIRNEVTLAVAIRDADGLAAMHDAVARSQVERRSVTLEPLTGGAIAAQLTVRGRDEQTAQLAQSLTDLDGVLGAPGVYGSRLTVD